MYTRECIIIGMKFADNFKLNHIKIVKLNWTTSLSKKSKTDCARNSMLIRTEEKQSFNPGTWVK